ncbi:Clavesin-2 [Amphibalanus amphitrite]|uniref:Clavesin-2 n=1 Tax=Amphibalanus amphitrite TaxID=1232801 RepID=A0A6A4W4S3_AMPAM|nr:Clavesin-2 [Amphibalanus amphitrite]
MQEYAEYADLWRQAGRPPAEGEPDPDPVTGAEEAVRRLRTLTHTRPDVVYLDTSDEYLLRFLRARKMRVSAAFELLTGCTLYRRDNPLLFGSFNAHSPPVRAALRDGFPGVLEQRDGRGRTVLLVFAAGWDPDRYPLTAIYRAILLTLDRLIEDVENQISGFVMVVDFSQFSLRQSKSVSPKMLRLMVNGLQDCYPARFGGVHFVSQPWYVEAMLSVIRPFLKEKVKDKIYTHGNNPLYVRQIYTHGNNLSALYHHVSRRILPAELGGDGPAHDTQRWADLMIRGPS